MKELTQEYEQDALLKLRKVISDCDAIDRLFPSPLSARDAQVVRHVEAARRYAQLAIVALYAE